MLVYGHFHRIYCPLVFKLDASAAVDSIMEDDSDISDVYESSDEEYLNSVANDAENGSEMDLSDSTSGGISDPSAVQVTQTPLTQPGPSRLRAIRRNYLLQLYAIFLALGNVTQRNN